MVRVMTTRNLLLGAAAALFIVAPASAGMPDGWYLSLEGGANWVQDWDLKQITTTPAYTTNGSISFDTGWAVLASVGYGFGHWAAEFEAGYRKNDLDKFTTDASPGTFTAIELDEVSLMANVRYNHPVTERITLSVGAGVGADYAQMKAANSGFRVEDEDWNFAYQGIASVNYSVGPRSELFLAYRYFRTTDAGFDFRPGFNGFFDGDEFVKHTATLGFRYHLNNGTDVPIAPQTTASDPGTRPSEYIIFFGHNKSDLTPAAMDVVREAASAAKDSGSANLRLVGHADRSGSDSYNQALSMRRANAVKGALVSEGVNANTIALDAKGESDPMVPTADGVREPQNRRVNINF